MSKSKYRVAPGVTKINGQPVPASRVMMLSTAEAMFDLAHGRLEPDLPTSLPAIDLVVPRESDIAPAPDQIAAPVTRSRRQKGRS